MRCGKTLAHWLFKQSNEIYGGTPPSLDNIKTGPESVKLFVNALFVRRTHISQNTKFKNILAATVLRFHGSFLDVIGNEPSVKYKDPTHHHFHHTIMSILSDTKISKQTFQKWQYEVIAGFNENNWLDVAIKKVGQDSAKRYVNSCSVVKVIDKKVEAIGRLHETIVNSSKDISIMSTTMGGMAQDLQSYGIEGSFIEVIGKEPSVKYNDPTHNHLHHK